MIPPEYRKVTGSALCSGRSSLKRISRPLLRKAIICSRSRIVRAENSRVSKTVSSGQKVTVVPVRPRGASPMTSSLVLSLPPSTNSMHVVLAVLVDLDDEAAGQRVHDRHADAVEAAGHLVAVAAELAAAVQLGEGDLDAGHLLLLVDVGGDALAVVGDPAPAVGQQGDVDAAGAAGHRLVDGVVDDLPHAVVEAARDRCSRCTCRGASGPGRAPPGPACCWPRRTRWIASNSSSVPGGSAGAVGSRLGGGLWMVV